MSSGLFSSFAHTVPSNVLPHPIAPPSLFRRPHRIPTSSRQPPRSKGSLRRLNRLLDGRPPARHSRLSQSRSIPHPALRLQALFPHPQSLFHVPRPVQRARIQHDHLHSLVFRSFEGSTSRRKGLLSRAWSQTWTLHVHGALAVSERRKIKRVCGIQCD